MVGNPFHTSGPVLAIFAPPFVRGRDLTSSHFFRFYVAFFLYYLGLPVALPLHLFGVYHIRNYALDVAAFSFGWFASRRYLHFILRAESPSSTWLAEYNYTGMKYPTSRPTVASRSSVVVEGSHISKYDSLLHCMFDLLIRLTPAPAPLVGTDDRAAGQWLRRNYLGRSTNPSPPGSNPYERLELGTDTLANYKPIPPDYMPFVPLALGFFFWWAVLDFRGFSRLVRRYLGLDVNKLLRFRL